MGLIRKKAQQEIVGFVLIVILVVVALMIFLIISLSKPSIAVESKTAESLLSSLMSYTTYCVVSEPHRENMRELIESCYSREQCANLNKLSCDYLNETLPLILNSLAESDATIVSLKINAVWQKDENSRKEDIAPFPFGPKCTSGAQKGEETPIYIDSGMIKVDIEICTEKQS